MNVPLDWLSPSPVINLGLALAALLALGLSVRLSRQVKALQATVERQKQQIEESLASSGSQLDRIEQQIAETEQKVEKLTPAPAAQRQISVATRNKIVRLHRIGMTADEIAEELDLKKGEVSLALKINGLILQPVAGGSAVGRTGPAQWS